MHQGYGPRSMRLRGPRAQGERNYRVKLQVDWDRVYLELGTRAARNKSRKAVGMGGAIIITVEEV